VGRTRIEPSSLELQRKQLDARLTNLPSLEPPRGGWVRTIRDSLGMTMKQMGARLGISAPAVSDIEQREVSETISIGRLRQAAGALDCELKFVLVPRQSLEATMRTQAARKAREERNSLMHTMHLEAQSEGVAQVLDEGKAIDRWLSERIARLWD
jgi:predicted DNA-binding mobile mystery protein A